MKAKKEIGEKIADGLNKAYSTDSTSFFWDDKTKEIAISVYSSRSECYASFAVSRKDIKAALKYSLDHIVEQTDERVGVISEAMEVL